MNHQDHQNQLHTALCLKVICSVPVPGLRATSKLVCCFPELLIFHVLHLDEDFMVLNRWFGSSMPQIDWNETGFLRISYYDFNAVQILSYEPFRLSHVLLWCSYMLLIIPNVLLWFSISPWRLGLFHKCFLCTGSSGGKPLSLPVLTPTPRTTKNPSGPFEVSSNN